MRLKKEERGTALTQQNWERFCVLLKTSSRSHRNPSVSPEPGQLGFGGTGTPAGQGAAQHSTAHRDAGPSTVNVQENKTASGTPWVSPETVQLHSGMDTGLSRGKGGGDVQLAIAN